MALAVALRLAPALRHASMMRMTWATGSPTVRLRLLHRYGTPYSAVAGARVEGPESSVKGVKLTIAYEDDTYMRWRTRKSEMKVTAYPDGSRDAGEKPVAVPVTRHCTLGQLWETVSGTSFSGVRVISRTNFINPASRPYLGARVGCAGATCECAVGSRRCGPPQVLCCRSPVRHHVTSRRRIRRAPRPETQD